MMVIMIVQLFKTATSSKASMQCQGACFNPLNAELNAVCRLLALLGAHHILHVSRVRVNVTCICYCHAKLRNFPTALQYRGWAGNGSKRVRTWSI